MKFATETLADLYNELKEHSVYTYLLLNSLEYNSERKDDKKYIAWIIEINKTDENEINNKNLYKTTNDKIENDVFSLDKCGYPFSEKEIGITISIPKPEPQKVFTDVNNNILPSKEPNIQIREIREQLTSTSLSDIITCEGKDYVIEVEKGNNTANYYLYFPDEYWSFTGSLKQSLLEICKKWNDKQYVRANFSLDNWEQKVNSKESQKRIKYFKNVMGVLDAWYEENELASPSLQPIEKEKISINGIPDDLQSDIVYIKEQIETLYSTSQKNIKTKIARILQDIHESKYRQEYKRIDFIKHIHPHLDLQNDELDWTPEQIAKNIK